MAKQHELRLASPPRLALRRCPACGVLGCARWGKPECCCRTCVQFRGLRWGVDAKR